MEALRMQVEEMREMLGELRDMLEYIPLGIDPERADRLAQLCDLLVDVPDVLLEIQQAREREDKRELVRTARQNVLERLYENFEAEFPRDSRERIYRRIHELADRLRSRPQSRWNLESCGERELGIWCLLQAEKRGWKVPGPRRMRSLVENPSTVSVPEKA